MPPRLCLITPPELTSGGIALDRFRADFIRALSAGDVAAVLLSLPESLPSRETAREVIRVLAPIAQDAGAAFLIEAGGDLAAGLPYDGVQLAPDPRLIKEMRRRLGEDMIIGADCATSRHAAMLAGEAGCDYVALHIEDRDTIVWWTELMELPCIAYGGITLENAAEIAALGADFLAADAAVWRNSDATTESVEAFNLLLERFRR